MNITKEEAEGLLAVRNAMKHIRFMHPNTVICIDRTRKMCCESYEILKKLQLTEEDSIRAEHFPEDFQVDVDQLDLFADKFIPHPSLNLNDE